MQNILLVVFLTVVTISAIGQQPASLGNGSQSASPAMAPSTSSASSEAVARARQMAVTSTDDAEANAAMGASLCRQAEAASDAGLYSQAEKAITKALQKSPNNFEALKAQVCVELGRHEFSRAREQAMLLNKRIPDDIMVYGLLVDANLALGNYPEAEDAAQWMLRLRPGNTPAFLHAADLREVFGEQQGALQLLKLVLDSSSPADAAGRAAILTRMARINLEIGDLSSAQQVAEAALVFQPSDPHVLAVMGQIRLTQGKPTEAVGLLRQSYKILPRIQTLYALAEAIQAGATTEEAKKTFCEFELQAAAQSSSPDNANLELIFFYADHANSPAKALQIAEQEIARRHDVQTLDAYAWALYKSGRYAEAKKQMDLLLKVGTREASVFRHAGEIELRIGDGARAQSYFQAAAGLTPSTPRDAKLTS